MHAIGGILKRQVALRFTNPTTNSYKRLVPGWLTNNRSRLQPRATARPRSASPVYSRPSKKAKRIEFRCSDSSSCNPYLAFPQIRHGGSRLACRDKARPRPAARQGHLRPRSHRKNSSKVPRAPTSRRSAPARLRPTTVLAQGRRLYRRRHQHLDLGSSAKEVDAIRLRSASATSSACTGILIVISSSKASRKRERPVPLCLPVI